MLARLSEDGYWVCLGQGGAVASSLCLQKHIRYAGVDKTDIGGENESLLIESQFYHA